MKPLIKQPRHSNHTVQDIAVYSYILHNLRSDGTFCQSEQRAADFFADAHRLQIHRTIKRLIEKGMLAVVAESRRGTDGWLTSKVLKPRGPLEALWGGSKSDQNPVNKDCEQGVNRAQVTESTAVSPSSPTKSVNKESVPSEPSSFEQLNTVYTHRGRNQTDLNQCNRLIVDRCNNTECNEDSVNKEPESQEPEPSAINPAPSNDGGQPALLSKLREQLAELRGREWDGEDLRTEIDALQTRLWQAEKVM